MSLRSPVIYPEWSCVPDAALALAALLACWTVGTPNVASPPLALAGAVLLASALAAVDVHASRADLAAWGRLGLAFVAGAALARSEGAARRLAVAWCAAGTAASLHAGLQVFLLDPALLRNPDLPPALAGQLADARASSVFLLPAQLGAFLAIGIALGVGLATDGLSRRARIATFGALLAMCAGLALAGSVGAVALAAGGAGVVAALRLTGSRRLAGLAAVGALACGLLAVSVVRRTAEMAGENPGSARALNWQVAALLVRESPLLGGGGGSFADGHARLRPARANDAHHAHQALLETAAEHGLIALPLAALALGSFAGACALMVRREGRSAMACALAGACAVAVGHALIDFGWEQPEWAVPSALLLGVAWCTAAAPTPLPRGRAILAVAGIALMVLVESLPSSRAASLRLRALDAAAGGDHASARTRLALARRWDGSDARLSADGASAAIALAAQAPRDSPERAASLAEATELAAAAVRLDSRHAAYHALLAESLGYQGRRYEALVEALRATQLAPRVTAHRELRDRLARGGPAP